MAPIFQLQLADVGGANLFLTLAATGFLTRRLTHCPLMASTKVDSY
jgi:hypothetical protein